MKVKESRRTVADCTRCCKTDSLFPYQTAHQTLPLFSFVLFTAHCNAFLWGSGDFFRNTSLLYSSQTSTQYCMMLNQPVTAATFKRKGKKTQMIWCWAARREHQCYTVQCGKAPALFNGKEIFRELITDWGLARTVIVCSIYYIFLCTSEENKKETKKQRSEKELLFSSFMTWRVSRNG